MMGRPLRILIIEDIEDHALLIVRELRKGGFEPAYERIETLAALEAAAEAGPWDAVISDFGLQGFDGLDALRLLQGKGLDLPFILVSGAIGEEKAAEVMKAGADDYILKGNYARLVPSLERELREATVRRERLRAEEELKRYRERLEELVQERTEDLVKAKAEIEELYRKLEAHASELEAANKELEVFSQTVSHDLRSPLNVINVCGQSLLEFCSDRLSAEGRSLVLNIRDQVRRMDGLIDTILRLAELRGGELRRTDVDLSAMAKEVAVQLRMNEPGRRARFAIADRLAVGADELLMRVVVENLLGNAWKYTAKEVEARIEFGATEVGGKSAFFVRDNGVGFDGAQAAEIFKPFKRLHGGKEFEGHGIGLASAQRIIQRHGGKIWAEGRVGEGASIYFTVGP